jgi:hypothetical protein
MQRKAVKLLCLALLFISPSAWALSGADLKDICSRQEATFQLSCLMYVGGVSDGLNLAPTFYRSPQGLASEIICFPEGVKQAVRKILVVKYLDAHEEQLAFPAEVLIYMALKEAWPCPG